MFGLNVQKAFLILVLLDIQYELVTFQSYSQISVSDNIVYSD